MSDGKLFEIRRLQIRKTAGVREGWGDVWDCGLRGGGRVGGPADIIMLKCDRLIRS